VATPRQVAPVGTGAMFPTEAPRQSTAGSSVHLAARVRSTICSAVARDGHDGPDAGHGDAGDSDSEQDLDEGEPAVVAEPGADHWIRTRPVVAMITSRVAPPDGFDTVSVPLAAQGVGVAEPAPR
jgi:hypothetical protein